MLKSFRYADTGQSGLEDIRKIVEDLKATVPIMHGTSSVGLDKYNVIL
jgi:hypothetical protein